MPGRAVWRQRCGRSLLHRCAFAPLPRWRCWYLAVARHAGIALARNSIYQSNYCRHLRHVLYCGDRISGDMITPLALAAANSMLAVLLDSMGARKTSYFFFFFLYNAMLYYV